MARNSTPAIPVAQTTPSAGATKISRHRFHTFACCKIYRSARAGKYELVWNSKDKYGKVYGQEAYDHVYGLHQNTPAQSRAFAEYINCVNRATDRKCSSDIVDGIFTADNVEYRVRGMYIWPRSRSTNSFAQHFTTIHKYYTASKYDMVSEEFAQLYKSRVYSTRDILRLWGSVCLKQSQETHTNTCKNYNINTATNKYVVVLLDKGDVPTKPYTHIPFINTLIDKIIESCTGTTRGLVLAPQNSEESAQKPETHIFPQPYPYSEGIINQNGECLTIACLQLLYHMSHIVQLCHTIRKQPNNPDIVTLINTMKSHAAYRLIQDADKPEATKLFAKFYTILQKFANKAHAAEHSVIKCHAPLEHLQKMGDQYVGSKFTIVMTHMLNQLSAASPELEMYIGGSADYATSEYYPACVANITHNTTASSTHSKIKYARKIFSFTSNTERDYIKQVLANASSNLPYKIIYLPSNTTNRLRVPIKYMPTVVYNTNINAAYRLIGAIINTVNHEYYIDLVNRVQYNGNIATVPPHAMFITKDVQSTVGNDSSKIGKPYHYALDDASMLLYARDEI